LQHGTSYSSAAVAAMLCAMQGSHTDMLCYYDARLTASAYGGFFAPLSYEPVCTYYSFVAFGELYALKNQVECKIEDCEDGIYAIAAANAEQKAIMIVNRSEEEREISVNVGDGFSVYLLDDKHFITKAELLAEKFVIAANQVVIIKNHWIRLLEKTTDLKYNIWKGGGINWKK